MKNFEDITIKVDLSDVILELQMIQQHRYLTLGIFEDDMLCAITKLNEIGKIERTRFMENIQEDIQEKQ